MLTRMAKLRIPVATYRIQFSRDFRFTDARDLVPYLHQLGITDLYSSPRFRPRRGSSHGYDVTSEERVNPDLGTEAEFDDMVTRLEAYDLGLLLDIVPNHMAASHENAWWMDVLEHGPASRYADYFDIDWHPQITKAAFLQDGKVLVPVLGEMYGDALRSGRLMLSLEESGFVLEYFERRFPIDSGTCSAVLDLCADIAEAEGLIESTARLRALSESSRRIGGREGLSPERAEERVAECRKLEQVLFLLHRDDLRTRLVMDRAVGEFSAQPERMHALLQQQAYRLAHGRIATEEINYRRFFDINDLVSLRVELPHVFAARHAAIRSLVATGSVTGLRIDHIDGLYDPRAYLDNLQEFMGGSAEEPAIYTVVEKILENREALPTEWATGGTTGYDFLNAVNDVFIDAEGLRQIEEAYRAMTGNQASFAELCYACNRLVMRQLFAGEVERLTHQLSQLAARHWIARDIPGSDLKAALVEITACLPVYRTYAADQGLSSTERKLLERTLDLARERMGPSVSVLAWQFLREVLLLEAPPYDPDLAADYLRFLRRWQQFTGPVMAKGLEDTAFYRDMSFLSRNEVGGDPLRDTPPFSVEQLHKYFAQRQRLWPRSLSATSTHDTKRSEDVRARLNVLAEIPERWIRALSGWRRTNSKLRAKIGEREAPSPEEEAMIYQTLLGAWPFAPQELGGFRERVAGFVRKSLREAKLHSDWTSPNESYEASVVRFAESLICAKEESVFQRSFKKLWQPVAYHGAWNSLSQVVIKITAPGVPDFYQGTELWAFHLVDPDNRVPVDYAPRRDGLHDLHQGKPRGRRALTARLARQWQDGRIKLFVTDAGLNFRRDRAALFDSGEYVPVEVQGPRRDSVFAFARRRGSAWSLTLAPRMTTRVSPSRGGLGAHADWQKTRLVLPEAAPERWMNLFTGEEIGVSGRNSHRYLDVDAALDRFPVAILFNPDK
jgi:(1->4)-alpha-D-glucan 1-alpha-D-glucosylmutase